MKKRRRYSNYDPYGPPTEQEWMSGGGSGLLDPNSTSTTGGWTAQNTVDVIGTGANLINSVLTAIFGKNSTVLANSYYQQYEQEKRTNTILWVVLGLVLALGVFLVIRKTK